MNKMTNGPIKMPLKGLAIGDGLCDPPNQMDYGDFLYQVGLLDETDRNLVQMHSEMAKISMDNEQWHLASSVKIHLTNSFFFLRALPLVIKKN